MNILKQPQSLESKPIIAPRYISWEAVYGIFLRDVKKFWRERSRLLGGVARPILWLLILGSSLKAAISTEAISGGVDYQQYIFPGVIGLTLIFSALQSAMSIIWDREFGFLKEVLAAPVPRLSIVIGKSLGGRLRPLCKVLSRCCLRRSSVCGCHLWRLSN